MPLIMLIVTLFGKEILTVELLLPSKVTTFVICCFVFLSKRASNSALNPPALPGLNLV